VQQGDQSRRQQRRRVEVHRQRLARRAVAQTRTGTGDHRQHRALGDAHGQQTADQARPRRVAVRGERAGEQGGAGAQAEAVDGRRERVAALLRFARSDRRREPRQQLQAVCRHRRRHHHEQPPAGLQEMKAAVSEVDSQRARGAQHAGEQHRQERA